MVEGALPTRPAVRVSAVTILHSVAVGDAALCPYGATSAIPSPVRLPSPVAAAHSVVRQTVLLGLEACQTTASDVVAAILLVVRPSVGRGT